jgi:hypothetical protein
MTSGTTDRRQNAGDRDHFIAVRKTDILDALIEHGRLAEGAERERFRRICRVLAAILHHEFFAELERLRDDYFYFNPAVEPHARLDAPALETAYTDLVASLERVLAEAGFVEMSHEEIARAHGEREVNPVEVAAPLQDFREVRFFRRGPHRETLTIKSRLGLRRRDVAVEVYDDVVIFVAVKPAAAIASARVRARLARQHSRPGAVLIKSFRNIPATDLNALFPNVRVVLGLRDKLLLSGPALVGGVPILIKLASTITILFLVIGFYFGLSSNIHEEETAGALAALSGLVALGGFIGRQWLRYQRQSLKYQKELADHVYFRNVNNNAGIFDSMIAAAEDQQCKEAFLAFYFLSTAPHPPDQSELEATIEAWLRESFRVDIAFEVDDALGRLERLGLLVRDGERLSVVAAEAALEKLDRAWADFFKPESVL